ncbi:MAG: hypothetical protein LC645_10055, partial [Geobacteraceae bacterium]|nr:hypothetical protein [Geobacteraceae bacterium]
MATTPQQNISVSGDATAQEQDTHSGAHSVEENDTQKAYQKEVERRRTFGIISHPDAGKTTLTEKLLLYGGAIQMAGAIKARKSSRHATSDWMAMEQDRGISVT